MKNHIYYLSLLLAFHLACNLEEIPEVTQLQPTACFSYQVQTEPCVSDCNVNFNASCSRNADRYSWDFGDGGTAETATPSHTYSGPGSYAVKLTVVNGNLQRDTTITITLTTLDQPVANFEVDPIQCTAPCEVTLMNRSTGEIQTYEWNFGDGSELVSLKEPGSHNYQTPGSYIISLSVTGPGGADQMAVSIEVIQPVYSFIKVFGTDGADAGVGVEQLEDGSYIVASYFNTHLRKLNEVNGTELKQFAALEGSNFWIDDILINKQNEIMLAGFLISGGWTQGAITLFDDELAVKKQVLGDVTSEITWYRNLKQNADGEFIVLGKGSNVDMSFGVLQPNFSFPPAFNQGISEYSNPWLDFGLISDQNLVFPANRKSDGEIVLVKLKPHSFTEVDWEYPLSKLTSANMLVADDRILVASQDENKNIRLIVLGEDKSLIFSGILSSQRGTIIDIEPAHDGGFILAGSTDEGTAGGTDALLIKIDADFNLEWERKFGEDLDEIGREVLATRDGGYIMVGSTKSFGNGDNDIYVVKTDANGNVN